MTVCKPAKKGPVLKRVFIEVIIALILVVIPLVGMAPVYGAVDLLLMPSPELPIQMAVRMNFLDLAACGNRYVAVGAYGLIIYSDDGGTTWQQASVPTSVTLTAVCFPTAQKGWAVGHDGVVLNTTDGGQTWKIQVSGLDMDKQRLAQIEKMVSELQTAAETAPEEEKEVLAVRLEDLQLLLSDMSDPIENEAPTTLLDVLFLDENTGFAIGAFGMIIQTKNGGMDWDPIVERMNNIDGYHYYGMAHIVADGRDVLLLVGERGLLLRSMDRGTTWQKLDSPHEGSFFGVTVSSDRKTVIAFGLGGLAFLSANLGVTWQDFKIPGHLPVSGAVTLSDGRFLLTTVNGKLFFTKKDGSNVSPAPLKAPGTITAMQTADCGFILAGSTGVQKITISDRKDD